MAFVDSNPQQLFAADTQNFGPEIGTDGLTPASYAHNSTTWTPTDGLTPALTTNPSRKRSRDESAFEAAGESSYFSHPTSQTISTPAPIPEEGESEPVYGEGMVLLSPETGRALSAESQTGTWYEERAAKEAEDAAQQKLAAEIAAEEAAKQFRPTMPVSRKSIRLSQSSIRAEIAPIISNGAPSPGSNAPSSPSRSPSDRPEVDEATIALGIGWTKMASEDPDLQAGARGWAKYIENHYRGIHGAEFLLKSRSLNAYLVGSQAGFYLFSEDLLEGKLVGTTWDSTLENLKSGQFEGTEVLRAERTPGPDEGRNGVLNFQQQQPSQTVLVNSNGTSGGMDLD